MEKHIAHVEDLVFEGSEKAGLAIEILTCISNADPNIRMTQKFDGNPCIVFGKHPINGRLFIASKYAFLARTDARICYTMEDVDRLYQDPTLNKRMKIVLKSVLYSKLTSYYSADFMFHIEDVRYKLDDISGVSLSFKPNIIEYQYHGSLGEIPKSFGLFHHTSDWQEAEEVGTALPDALILYPIKMKLVKLPGYPYACSHNLSGCHKLLDEIDSKWIKIFRRWITTLILNKKFPSSGSVSDLSQFWEFFQTEYIKEGEALKSVNGKRERLKDFIERDRYFIREEEKFRLLLRLIFNLVTWKNELIAYYEPRNLLKESPYGEGFVVDCGTMTGTRGRDIQVKLVNRSIFTNDLFVKLGKETSCTA